MKEIVSFIKKIMEPESISQILGVVIFISYLMGRITKKQFVAEQMKVKGLIDKSQAKRTMEKSVLGPINGLFEVLNFVPGINKKLPVVNLSVPEVLQNVSCGSIGFIGDILHNFPGFGTNINKKN
ncbi:hypothetical protein ACFL2K_01020 [Candidatus Margulisiibacteriota bacterium]